MSPLLLDVEWRVASKRMVLKKIEHNLVSDSTEDSITFESYYFF